jgi:hypothetical protein
MYMAQIFIHVSITIKRDEITLFHKIPQYFLYMFNI